MIRKILVFIFLFATISFCYGQKESSIEFLHTILKKQPENAAKVETLLKITNHFIFKPITEKSDSDSVSHYYNYAKKLSKSINYIRGSEKCELILARIERRKQNADKGKAIANASLQKALKNGRHVAAGDAYIELSHFFPEGLENEKIAELVEKAVKEYRKGKDNQALSDGLCNLSEIYFSLSNYNKSITAGLEALEKFRPGGRRQLQDIYSMIGIGYNYLGINQESIKYGLLAAKHGDESGDTSIEMCIAYNNIGISYFYMQNYKMAQKYHEIGYNYAVKNNDLYWIYTLASNIVNDLLYLKRYKEAETFFNKVIRKYQSDGFTENFTVKRRLLNIYIKLKKFELAKKNNNEMLAIAKNSPDELGEMGIFMAHESAIEFYFAVKNFPEARIHLNAIDENAQKAGAKNLWKRVYNWKFKIDSAQGNYVSAIKNYQKFKSLNDSIIEQSKGNQINLLQIQYETEKKDKDIAVKSKNIQSLEKQGELQQEKIDKDRITRTIIILFSGLLIIILALLYNSYRIKQKSNNALQIKQDEIENKNVSLQNLVTEKEWLLKEIHHRVKNNLQIVMSLLNTQSAYLSDKAALTAIRDSQHRVHSMSLIHQKLYKSDNLAAINMPEYINELVEYLKDSFDLSRKIRFEIDIEDLEMDVSQAVPIGLILNEAITNAIKYAFPNKTDGKVKITLQHSYDDYFILEIADEGIGLPEDFEIRKTNSLGMSLIQGLTGDLDGNFKIGNDNGTKITIEFLYNYSLKNNLS